MILNYFWLVFVYKISQIQSEVAEPTQCLPKDWPLHLIWLFKIPNSKAEKLDMIFYWPLHLMWLFEIPNSRAEKLKMIFNWPLYLMSLKCQTLDNKDWIWSSTDHSILCDYLNTKLLSRNKVYYVQLTTPSYVIIQNIKLYSRKKSILCSTDHSILCD